MPDRPPFGYARATSVHNRYPPATSVHIPYTPTTSVHNYTNKIHPLFNENTLYEIEAAREVLSQTYTNEEIDSWGPQPPEVMAPIIAPWVSNDGAKAGVFCSICLYTADQDTF